MFAGATTIRPENCRVFAILVPLPFPHPLFPAHWAARSIVSGSAFNVDPRRSTALNTPFHLAPAPTVFRTILLSPPRTPLRPKSHRFSGRPLRLHVLPCSCVGAELRAIEGEETWRRRRGRMDREENRWVACAAPLDWWRWCEHSTLTIGSFFGSPCSEETRQDHIHGNERTYQPELLAPSAHSSRWMIRGKGSFPGCQFSSRPSRQPKCQRQTHGGKKKKEKEIKTPLSSAPLTRH